MVGPTDRTGRRGSPTGAVIPISGAERATKPSPEDDMTNVRPLRVRTLGLVPYAEALEVQRQSVVERRAGRSPDVLLLLEHPHVITLGSSGDPDHVLVDAAQRASRGIEVHEAGRGGDVTYHGPGQLVGYPILDLKPDRKDLHRYLRDLEEVLLRALARLGVSGGARREGLTGVWLPQGKVAAVGVRVSSGWITSHGFALNCSTDLSYFDAIVPCGIQDEAVTSLSVVLGSELTPADVSSFVIESFLEVFGRALVS